MFERIPWTRTGVENDWGTELADLDGDGRFERVDWNSDREGAACVGETDGRTAMFLPVIDGIYRWTTAGWVRAQPGAYAPAFRATVPHVLRGASSVVLHLDSGGRAAAPGGGTRFFGNPGDGALLPALAEAGVSVERMTDWVAALYPPALRGEANDCVTRTLAAYREDTSRWEATVAAP